MYKSVGKPIVFIVVIFIAALTYLAYSGVVAQKGDERTVYVAGAQDIRFGIDIKGGVDVTFIPNTADAVTKDDMQKAVTIINTRLDNLGILDRDVFADYTNNRIIVSFPPQSGATTFDPETQIKELGSMAQLVFKSSEYNNGADIITGDDVANASVKVDPDTKAYYVSLTLKSSGIDKFAAATKALYASYVSSGKQNGWMDIYMDSVSIEHAQVISEISGGDCSITGNFTSQSATELANQINAGSLPFSLTTSNFSTISPTLGENALNVMIWAGCVAFIIVCLFMIIYYRLPGFIACIALVGHIAGTLLAISIPQFTLTLPGIAGIILSIGMGVDCNVITFERIKEELRLGRTLDGSIDAGFEKSFAAIFDGNVTVLIVGVILWFLGSATIKSFGYTLLVGVIMNLIMGIIMSRFMLRSVSRFKPMRATGLYTRAGRVEA